MLGENIKRIRENKKLGLNETARKAGISGSYLSDIEKGKKQNPSMDTLKSISKALDTTIDELLQVEPITQENLKECNEEHSNLKESKGPLVSGSCLKGALRSKLIEQESFTDAQEAIQLILKRPSVMKFGGFDVDKLTEEEIVEFANELLNQLKILSYKYKK
ncbi:MAG: helix-turn-helix domain-containing protein [Clostridium argentinense]|nr:helix-turn-helix domain-containing protein [Clostridium argentinense]